MIREELWDQLGQLAEGEFGHSGIPEPGGGSHQLPSPDPTFESYEQWVSRTDPAYRWYRHNKELATVCQGIADGSLKRVIICIPPGTGKSETFSRKLAAYYLYRFPSREVGLVSYGASLAEDLAGDAREAFIGAGGALSNSTAAKGDWATTAGGGMWGKGFAGPIRGRRFHLGIIDDPHKGPEDLESEALCEKFQKWYRRTWLNRQNLFFSQGAAIVIVMQRLAENDLVGWLTEQPDAAQWTVVHLDAERVDVDEEFNYPAGVTRWPDWREPGELLCPELLPRRVLAEQKEGNEDAYEAQFQQHPRAMAGMILDPLWFPRCTPEQVPLLFRTVEGVDLAVSTKDSADFTAGFPAGFGVNTNIYVFRPVHGRMEAPDARIAIAQRAREIRASQIAVEAVAFQLSFVQDLLRMPELAGIAVIPVAADKDKLARARGWAPLASAGRIILVDDGSGWVEKFLEEVRHFPRRKKDQIDALGIAIEALRGLDPGGTIALVGGGRVTSDQLSEAARMRSR